MRLKIRSVLTLQQQGADTHQIIHVPVAQWIEQWPPEPCAQVRFLSGTFHLPDLLTGGLNMSETKKKKKNYAGLLIFIWVFFIAAIAAFGTLLYINRETLAKDLGFVEKTSYTVNSNEEVNNLISVYFKALASADQETLQGCVTAPQQYDNMTTVEGRSKVITDYTDINCYYVDGPEPDSYIVFTIMNITITDVNSRPLDIYKPMHIVKMGDKYLIDNSAQSQELQDFINQLTLESDIQDLYRMVKTDQDSKAASDPSFAEFLNKLNN